MSTEKKSGTYDIGDFVAFLSGHVTEIYLIISSDGEGNYMTKKLIPDGKNPGIYIVVEKTEVTRFNHLARTIKNIIVFPETRDETWSKKKWYDQTAENGSLGLLQLFFGSNPNLNLYPKHYVNPGDIAPKQEIKDVVIISPPAYELPENPEQKPEQKFDTSPLSIQKFDQEIPDKLKELLRSSRGTPSHWDCILLRETVFFHSHVGIKKALGLVDLNFTFFKTNFNDNTLYDGTTELRSQFDLVFLDYQGASWKGSVRVTPFKTVDISPQTDIKLLFAQQNFADKSILAISHYWHTDDKSFQPSMLIEYVKKYAELNGYVATLRDIPIYYGLRTETRLYTTFIVTKS
jgi:hypothetical protein